jgi:hypothetical protein
MSQSDISGRNPLMVYILPFLHLGACLAIWFGHIDTGWQKLIILDFPFSVILAGLMFRDVNPLLSFGVLGTIWWYLLSRMIRWLFRAASGRSA